MSNLNGDNMILKDYKCELHGYFESGEPRCPEGCTVDIYVVHLQAPGLKSDTTKNVDKTVQGLADDFKMTDVKSTREGEYQSGYHTRNNSKESKRAGADNGVMWGNAGNMSMQNILRGNMFKSVAGEQVSITPSEIGSFNKPKTASYIQDHENLKVK